MRDRGLLRELGHCAWKTLRRGLAVALGDRTAVPGAILVRATAGDLLNAHPHLHVMVSAGAWTDGGRGAFRPWPRHLTGERLEPLFRRYVLRLLLRRERLASETAERLMKWSPSGLSVWVGEPILPHETESRQRLARYLLKPPLALERMRYDRNNCTVRYVSYAQKRERTLSALDFLAELSVHVPDPGEHTASYFGRCSNRSRGERRKAERVEQPPAADPEVAGTSSRPGPPTTVDEPRAVTPSRKAFRTAWARLLQRVWKVDLSRCPRCGGGMRILDAVLSRDAIRRILVHLDVPSPRAPNPHERRPPPGTQLLVPERARAACESGRAGS